MKRILLLSSIGLALCAVTTQAQILGINIGRHGVSVGIGAPVWSAPAPVCSAPPAVVYAPAPTYYAAPQAYYPPPVVYSYPGAYSYGPTVVVGGGYRGGWDSHHRSYGHGGRGYYRR